MGYFAAHAHQPAAGPDASARRATAWRFSTRCSPRSRATVTIGDEPAAHGAARLRPRRRARAPARVAGAATTSRIVAVADPDPARRAAARRLLPAARVYDDAAALLAARAARRRRHRDAAGAARAARHRAPRAAGCHVLCEKPLVTTLRRLSRRAPTRSRAAGVTLCHRAQLEALRRSSRSSRALLADGAVGRPTPPAAGDHPRRARGERRQRVARRRGAGRRRHPGRPRLARPLSAARSRRAGAAADPRHHRAAPLRRRGRRGHGHLRDRVPDAARRDLPHLGGRRARRPAGRSTAPPAAWRWSTIAASWCATATRRALALRALAVGRLASSRLVRRGDRRLRARRSRIRRGAAATSPRRSAA